MLTCIEENHPDQSPSSLFDGIPRELPVLQGIAIATDFHMTSPSIPPTPDLIVSKVSRFKPTTCSNESCAIALSLFTLLETLVVSNPASGCAINPQDSVYPCTKNASGCVKSVSTSSTPDIVFQVPRPHDLYETSSCDDMSCACSNVFFFSRVHPRRFDF